jgi:UDP-N-acetylglucosamine transferase subunit ALG13
LIFVTVGGQLPFDRMIRIIDDWVRASGRTDVFCQIGDADYEPEHAAFTRFLSPDEFAVKLEAADILIAHSGMGTIITAMQIGKPIVVFPRQAKLGEQRNDHQLGTARAFKQRGDTSVAMDEPELREILANIDQLEPAPIIGPAASESLLGAIREFLES